MTRISASELNAAIRVSRSRPTRAIRVATPNNRLHKAADPPRCSETGNGSPALQARASRSNGSVRLPPPDHPDSFEVAVNRSVALALGIRVPTSELIRQRMARSTEP